MTHASNRMSNQADCRHHTEPRAARYWELIGIIKGWSPSPIAAAHAWLVASLRERVGAAAMAE